MYNPGEIKAFCLKSCYLRLSFNLCMNVMQQLGSNLPYDTQCQGPRAQTARLFLIFTYIRQEEVVIIPKVPGAWRNASQAQE